MQSQRWQDIQISCGKLVQILFIIGAIIFLLTIAVNWILSVIGLISAMWAAILTVISGIVVLLLAFLQWYFPRSPSSPNLQASTASSPEHVPPQLITKHMTHLLKGKEKSSPVGQIHVAPERW